MTGLVADVGGTNTRLALVGGDGRPGPARYYRNDDFPGFGALLAAWRDDAAPPPLTGACIAVAGPVTTRRARLTNRGWLIDRAAVAAALGLQEPGRLRLINDLAALGHALAALDAAQVEELRPGPSPSPSLGASPANDQMLVAGLGTGFNISLVQLGMVPPVVIEAELGHASLPSSISAILTAAIGARAAGFETYEALFSGPGLARLCACPEDGAGADAAALISAYDPARRDRTAHCVELTARSMAVLARELVFLYQPHAGLHFAGSVARGLLGSPARAVFLEALRAPGPFGDQIAGVPLRLITDDAAGLTGAAQVVRALARDQ
ncbi:glucokinase [Pukyongiella litopenaei]|uniref:glucokinase n=1 Tax=Pukyongiella litopenaei TaxID=2605946 RepID=UPI001B808C6D|nr:glucokinase [Pukyongiella litopenaei]